MMYGGHTYLSLYRWTRCGGCGTCWPGAGMGCGVTYSKRLYKTRFGRRTRGRSSVLIMGTSCVEDAWVWIGIGEGSMAWPTGMEMSTQFNERRRRPGFQHAMQTQLFSGTGAHAYIFTRSTSSLESLSCCAKKKACFSPSVPPTLLRSWGKKTIYVYTRIYLI